MVGPKAQQIAQQNDQFRRGNPDVPGIRVITAGLDQLLKRLEIPQVLLAQVVAQFDDFNQHNDPHCEHDFGAFEFHGPARPSDCPAAPHHGWPDRGTASRFQARVAVAAGPTDASDPAGR